MNKYGLIGRDISHSLSPMLYRELISPNVHYDLLDYENESLIPSVLNLFKEYSGINITAPYKTHFLGNVNLTENAKKLGAINCLGLKNGQITGENTDYLAILDILADFKEKHPSLHVLLLGDGVMSKVTQNALRELDISFEVRSRRLNSDFISLNIKSIFENKINYPLIINSCAREYHYEKELPSFGTFWDFNYKFIPHIEKMKNESIVYLDGFSMLKKQAEYAVAFWSISK